MYFELAGSTRPASRLISISARPKPSERRCVQMSARASAQARAMLTRGFFVATGCAIGSEPRAERDEHVPGRKDVIVGRRAVGVPAGVERRARQVVDANAEGVAVERPGQTGVRGRPPRRDKAGIARV